MNSILKCFAIVALALLYSSTGVSAQTVAYVAQATAPTDAVIDLAISETRVINVPQTVVMNGVPTIIYVPTTVQVAVAGQQIKLTPQFQNVVVPGPNGPMTVSMYVGHRASFTISRPGMFIFAGTYRDAAGVLRSVNVTTTQTP